MTDLQPKNYFTAALATAGFEQKGVADQIFQLRQALPNADALLTGIDAIGTATLDAGAANVAWLGRIATIAEIERVPARRAPTSHLYLGVNVDGSFNHASHIGEMLMKAAGGDSLKAISGRNAAKRTQFIRRGMELAGELGLSGIGDQDFADFYDQAPHVLKNIEESGAAPPVPPSSPAPTVD